MYEALEQATLAPPTLFGLLARVWHRPAAITTATFNADQTAVAFAGADGSVAIVPVADPEAPASRMRTDIETGRTTIRPRSKPVRPATVVGPLADRSLVVAPYRGSGFLVGADNGGLHHLTARGQVVRLPARFGEPIVAVDRHAATGSIAVATGFEVVLYAESDLDEPARREAAPAAVTGAAVSPDGSAVAATHAKGLSIWQAARASSGRRDLPFPGDPTTLRWSPGGDWIACPLAAGGFRLLRLADGSGATITGYPSPVRRLGWSRAADALVTSGAFRVAAWSMVHPPLDGATAGALATGRPRPVPAETVAAHPTRDLVAAGYADGLVTIAQIGRRDEVLVQPDAGAAVTELAWSQDGSHLALGTADGTAAIVAFPPEMFK